MTKRTRWVVLAAVFVLGLAACGGGGEVDTPTTGSVAATTAAAGETTIAGADTTSGTTVGETEEGGTSLADNFDLSGTSIRMGSKDFTEQLLLGQIAAQALEAAGATVELVENLPSPAGPRDALLAGEVDAAWEYTGTAWFNYLGNTEPIDDPMEQWQSVKDRDLEENNIFWTEPAPFDDTYGIATNRPFSEENNLSTLEDVAAYVADNPDEATLCLDATFGSRDDGLVRFEEAYGVDWPDDNLIVQDFGVIYQSTADGNPCNFGEVFTTDGRIVGLDLVLMEDTESAFISYLSAVMIANDFHEQNPEVADLLVAVGQPLDEARMTELNAQVDVDGEFPEDVARQYLIDEGFIEG